MNGQTKFEFDLKSRQPYNWHSLGVWKVVHFVSIPQSEHVSGSIIQSSDYSSVKALHVNFGLE